MKNIVKYLYYVFLIFFSLTQVIYSQTNLSKKSKQKVKIYSVSFSPDGRYALTGCSDLSAYLWNVSTGRKVRTFEMDSWDVHSVAFSHNGQYVLLGSVGAAWLLEMETGKKLFSLQVSGFLGRVLSVDFSPDDQYALTGGNEGTAQLWEVATGKKVHTFDIYLERPWEKGQDIIEKWKLNEIGGEALTLVDSKGKYAVLFDSIEGERILLTGREVTSVAFSPNGQHVIAGSVDNTAKLLDLASGRIVFITALSPEIGHSSLVTSVAFSPDGRYVLTGSYDKTAKLWDLVTEKILHTFRGHLSYILSVAISSDGRYVLTGSRDKTAKLWDMNSKQEVRTLKEHSKEVTSVAFSPDCRYVLTGSSDGTAKLWEVETGRVVITLNHGEQ